MGECDHKELAARLICAAFAVLAVYLLFEYGLFIILPFLLAFLIGVPINKLSSRLNCRYKVPKKLASVIILLCVLALLSLVVYYGLGRLLGEIEELVSASEAEGGGMAEKVELVVDGICDVALKLPIIKRFEGLASIREKMDAAVSRFISDAVSRLTALIPTFAVEFVKRTPKAVITFIVTLLACFYFAIDHDGIKKGISALIPKSAEGAVTRFHHVFCRALSSYAKAYLLIMLITFAEVFAGLLILGRSYAFIIAIGIAVVDVLPLFGTGAVLVPWAIVSFIMGDHAVGTGLLVIYGVVTIVRQLIEPKIVGANLGIHPLATLFAMFAGLSLFGFFGMLAGPFVILVIKELYAE